jgi:hypothetical protein
MRIVDATWNASTQLLVKIMSPTCVVECKSCRNGYLTSKFVVGAGYYVMEFLVIIGAATLVSACCGVSEMQLFLSSES